jgi:hypothetical protein
MRSSKNWAHDIEKMDDEGKALAREITLGARAIHKDEARIEEILDSLSKLLGVDIQDLGQGGIMMVDGDAKKMRYRKALRLRAA